MRRRKPRIFLRSPNARGEQWCRQYHREHGVDVRCLRLPVLIRPALARRALESTPAPILDQRRPVLHVDDAVRAVLELMAAPASAIREDGPYQVNGVSISVAELVTEIQFHHPKAAMEIWNLPDHTGPASIDDSAAQTDWGWKLRYDLLHLVKSLLQFQQ
jgi:nucleoside-diphosphate-sugar epimerase